MTPRYSVETLNFLTVIFLFQDTPAIEQNLDKSYMNGDHVDDSIYAARPKSYSEYRSETVIERY